MMDMHMPASRIAIIGAGISGLSAAWLLSQKYEVTLFEAADRLGGHTNTVDVSLDGMTHPVDTGFLVFNNQTYPNFSALLDHLEVTSVETEMSFAVSLTAPDIEWAGSSLATVFGQKRNILRPRFWRMLRDILRFNRESVAWLEDQNQTNREISLRDYLISNGYSSDFAEWYLLPMAAAIWSCPASTMLDYPLATFVRFCSNHGLLQISNRPLWRSIVNGGREYVKKMVAEIRNRGGKISLASPVLRVERGHRGVLLHVSGGIERFDQVVFACHSDQALKILGVDVSAAERNILGAIRYQPNRAVLHTDPALLPRDSRLWSAWNYSSAAAAEPGESRPVSVSYLINRLQPLPFRSPVIVSLNPQREPLPEAVIAEFDYAHPLFDVAAIAAQSALHTIQGNNGAWYCGAWGGYGFHEDGLKSALRIATALGCDAPWQAQSSRLADWLQVA